MKIDKTFKIKEKYFNAILTNEEDEIKKHEIRHEYVSPNSIVELKCVENNKSIIFRSGNCVKYDYIKHIFKFKDYYLEVIDQWSFTKKVGSQNLELYDWWDDFCYTYLKQAVSYAIEIAEILEVK